MMKKKLLALAMVSALVLGGCGSSADSGSEEAVEEETVETDEAAEETGEAADDAADEETGDEEEADDGEETADAEEESGDVEDVLGDGTISYSISSAAEDEDTDETESSLDGSRLGELIGDGDAIANIIGSDDRVPLDEYRDYYPFSAIVLVETTFSDGTVIDATGTLIGSNEVLTAGTALVDPNVGIWPESVYVAPLFSLDEQPLGVFEAIEIAIPDELYDSLDGLSGDDWYADSTFEYDLGLVTLEGNLGDQLGYFGMQWQSGSMDGTEVYTAGYAEDGSFMGTDGTIEESDKDLLTFDFDVDSTQTGSPIFVLTDDDECNIVGVYTASTSKINVGVRITASKLAWIKTEMADFE